MSTDPATGDGDERLILGFDLEAAKRLDDPDGAFAQAQTWSAHVGIISRDPRAAKRYAETHGLAQEFFTGNRGKGESLALVRQQFSGDRFVFVGASSDARRLAERTDWEYIDIAEAAEKAGWDLAPPSGVVARLRHWWDQRR